MTASLVLGSRGSALALWQARHVAARLEAAHPGLSVRLEIIKTTGDKILDVPLAKVGGKGLFVKEIEEALLERRIDFAVHSMKDVPAVLPAGLVLAAFSAREDPRDALCTRDGRALDSLPTGARVGTSSLRRMCQLRAMRADLEIVPLRGNVDTRLRKLDAGEFDAIVLAAAGLVRLGHASRIAQRFADPEMLPAIAQGVLGIETREDDPLTRPLVAVMHDETAATCVRAERAFLRRLGGGCQVPIAGHATLSGERIRLQGLVASPSRGDVLRAERSGHAKSAEPIGAALAEELLSMGAEQILREIGASAPDAAP